MSARAFGGFSGLSPKSDEVLLSQIFCCSDVGLARMALLQAGGDLRRAVELMFGFTCGPRLLPIHFFGSVPLNPRAKTEQDHGDQYHQAGFVMPRASQDKEICGPSTFPALPLEVFLEITSFLTKRDLCALRLVGRGWRDAVDEDVVWKDQLLLHYGLREGHRRAWSLSAKEQYRDAERLRWSRDDCSHKIELSNTSRTARDVGSEEEKLRWVTTLTDNVFAGGKHYVEIVVDHCCDNSNNTIKIGFGATDKCSALTSNCPFGYCAGSYASEDRNSWVYLADGRIMAQGQPTATQGEKWSNNDRIGLLLDFHAQRVSFYYNSHQQGPPLPMPNAARKLRVAVSLICSSQVTLTNGSIKTILP